MATEIELKAHIPDKEAVKRRLFEKASFLWSFDKADTYWSRETGSELPNSRIRFRREKLVFPDKSEKISCLVTCKTKERRDGIEVNNEKEFEVRAQSNQAEPIFEEFLLNMGLKPEISKKKQGWAFNRDGINAELCEVKGLGWFIELEILLEGSPENSEDSYNENRDRLLNFLDSLGIKREAIEDRFYTEMLQELR